MLFDRSSDLFNDEVLYVRFMLVLGWPGLPSLRLDGRGPCFPGGTNPNHGRYPPSYEEDSFTISLKLQKSLEKDSANHPVWLVNIRAAIASLQARLESEPLSRHLYECCRFPLFHRPAVGLASAKIASTVVCISVASHFNLEGLEKRLDLNEHSVPSSEYLQHSPTFWLFTTACYTGDAELLQSSLAYLTSKFEVMAGIEIEDTRWTLHVPHGSIGRGQRQAYYWKDALSPCLSIAARRGHAHIVQYLLQASLPNRRRLPTRQHPDPRRHRSAKPYHPKTPRYITAIAAQRSTLRPSPPHRRQHTKPHSPMANPKPPD